MRYFVYILKCKDGSYYTGITSNVQRRVAEHNLSRLGAKSLRGKLPVRLIYSDDYQTRSEALKREHEIKGWRREKKLKLVNALALRSATTMRV